MALPSVDTLVHYPDGDLVCASFVRQVSTLADGRVAVLLDATSVHPVDAGWPDQGADRAVLRVGDQDIPIEECIVGASDGTALYLGREIPVGKGTDGWAFVVAHIVAAEATGALPEGAAVETVVDAGFRGRTSAGHTLCHLASLALNRALADRWKKEIRPDALGAPDFDGLAIDVSLIRENGSLDTYRLGKSLRKKGFVTEGFIEALPAVESAVGETLTTWLATDAPVHVDRDGDRLTDRRYWACALPDGEARIPCGGTHVRSLSALGAVSVTLSTTDVDGTTVLTMDASLL